MFAPHPRCKNVCPPMCEKCLSQEISCCRKKFPVTGEYFLICNRNVVIIISYEPVTQSPYISGPTLPPSHQMAYVILKPKMSKITHKQSYSVEFSGEVLGVKKILPEREKFYPTLTKTEIKNYK